MQATVRETSTAGFYVDSRATLFDGIDRIANGIPAGDGWANYAFNGLTLRSNFQPIFGVAEQRCMAFEGLLRATNLVGEAMQPETVFALSASQQEELILDWLCRGLHLRNFKNIANDGDLIFINAYPEAAIEDPHHPQVFAQMLAYYNIDPATVVIEILETGVSDESQLVDAVNLYRSLGCKVAIDDFGVGFSNFDRLWRLRPDFVKIDRSIIHTAARETHAKLVLASMVKLIQHCGAKVIVEGIENRDEALTALEVGGDYLQGYFFARPGVAGVLQAHCDNMFAALDHIGMHVSQTRVPPKMPVDDALAIYVDALNLAAMKLQGNETFAAATEGFRALPQVLRIYLVCEDAGDPTHNKAGDATRLVLNMIETAHGLPEKQIDFDDAPVDRLQRVLRHALAAPRRVHISEATPAPRHTANASLGALTLSCAFDALQRTVVLCADLARD